MEQTALQGHKGGSQKQHTPVETKNNLLSKSIAKVLLAIGEGEFAGTPTAADIYLDGTPLVSAGGLENFGGVKWEYRSGRSDQSYIAGMPDVSNEFAVGFELEDSSYWTRYIADSQLDAIRITLAWPALYQQQDNGDITGYNIEYGIWISTDGGAYVEQGRWDTGNGKTNVEYDRTHRITLPKPGSSWTVQVRRLTPNQRTAKFADIMTVKSFAEVIDAKLRYPNTALLYVEFDAETFGGSSIPKVSIKTKGRLVQVPSNYEPTSRAYNGVWNGTFKWAWTDNPAWVFYDLVTNERFGLGARISADMVDKWTLYQVAQYCDVLVSDGKGGQEPRYTCNIYIQSRKEAWQVLRDIIGIFNGMLHWSGTQIVASADMPVAVNTVRTYNRSNVIDGKFTYGSTSEKTIATTALVSYDDPENHYETAVEAVNDLTLVQRYKTWNQAEIAAIGVTSRGQAQRKGKYQMLTNSLNRVVTFKLGLEGYLPRPGEVFGVADQVLAGSGFSGRISAASARTITCDRVPNAAAGDILFINKTDGTTAEGRTIQSVNGKVITVTTNYSEVPTVELGWYVEKTTLKSQLFRTTKVTWSDNDAKFEVTGVQYEDSKYAAIDSGARLESRPITNVPAGGQDAPTNLTLSSYSFIEQGLAVTTLSVSWTRAPGAMNYEAQWRKDGGDWLNVGRTTSTGFEVKGIYKGDYQARVRAFNTYGSASIWVESDNKTMNGKEGAPPVPATLTTESLLFGIALKWTFPAGAEDTARTELWYNTVPDLATATKLSDLAYPQSDYTMQGLRAGQQFFFWARLVDKSENIGEFYPGNGMTVMGQASSDAGAILDQIADSIGKSELGQELLGDINRITDDSPGSVNDRINQAKDILSEQITSVANDLTTVNNTLTQTKADLEADIAAAQHDLQELIDSIDIKETLPYDATKTYTTGQITLGTDSKLYRAKQNVPVNTAPPNTTYWLDIGDVVVTADGLAARVSTAEQSITNINGTLTAQSNTLTNVQSSLNNKADASALSSLTTRVTNAEGTLTTQGQAITGLQTSLSNKADASALSSLTTRVTNAEGSLTSQGQSITNINTSLNNIGGENLLYNPSFEVAGTTSGLAEGWGWRKTSTTVVTPTLVASTLDPTGKAQRLDISGLSAGTGTQYVDFVPSSSSPDTRPGMAEGSVSTASVYVRGTVGLLFQLYVQYKNSSGTTLATSGPYSYNLTDTWTRINLTNTAAPAGTVQADVLLRTRSAVSSSVVSGFVEMDRAQLELGSVLSGWSDNTKAVAAATSANASATSALTTRVTNAEGAITSQGQSITNLTNNLAGKADASALNALTTRVSNAEGSLTSQGSSITNLQASIGNIASDNLLLDPTFSSTSGSTNQPTAVPTARNASGVPANSPGATVLSWPVPTDTANRYLAFSVNPNVRTPENALTYSVAVAQAETYDYEVWVYQSVSRQVGIWIQMYDSANTSIAHDWAATSGDGARLTTSAGFWVKLTGSRFIPAGVVRMAFTVRVTAGNASDVFIAAPAMRKRASQENYLSAATSNLDSRVSTAEGTILSQSTSLTNLTASVNGIGGNGANLMPAEYSTFTDTLPTIQKRATTTVTAEAYTPAYQTHRLKVVDSEVSTGYICLYANNNTLNLRLKPNQKYIFSFWGEAPVARNLTVRIRYLNASSVQTEVSIGTIQIGATWGRYSAVCTTPNVVMDGRAELLLFTLPVAGSMEAYFDGFMLEEMIGSNTTPSSFSPGNSTYQVSGQASATSALTARVTSAESNLTSQSGLITQLDNSLGDAGGENLHYNPVFRAGTGSMPVDGWVEEGAATSVNTTQTSWMNSGENSVSMSITGLTTTVYKTLRNDVLKAVPVAAGQTVTASIYVKSSVNINFRIYIQFRNSSGTVLSTPVTAATPVTSTVSRITLTGTAPVGAVDALVYYRSFGTSTTAMSAVVELARPQFEYGSKATGWRNNGQLNAADNAANSSAISSLTSTVNSQGSTITSQGQSITSLNNSITAIGGTGTNLLSDEYSWLTSTTLPTMNGSASTWAGVAVSGSASGFGIKMTSTSTTAGYVMLCPTNNAAGWNIPVEPGTYLVSFYASAPSTATLRVRLYSATVSAYSNTITLTTTRTRYTLPVVLTGTSTIALLFYFNQSAISGTEVTIDSAMVEEQIGNGTTASPFVAGPSARSITAQATAMTALTNRVTNAEGTLTSQASSITNLTSTLNGIGGTGTNLLGDDYSWLTSTTLPPIYAAASTVTGVAVAEALSGYGMTIASTSAQGQWASVYLAPSASVAGANMLLEPGNYIVSAYVKGATAGTLLYNLYDMTTSATVAVAYTTTRTRLSGVINISKTSKVALLIYPNYHLGSSASITVDSIMVEKQVAGGTTPSPFSPGASARALSSLSTTVTQQGSTITSQASQISGLQTTVGNNTASIQQLSTTTTNTNNSINASWSVKLMTMSNGQQVTAGFGLGLGSVGGVTQSTFAVSADRFAVLNSNLSGTLSTPFSVVGGVTYLADAFIRNASITNAKIGGVIQSDAVDGYGRPLWSLNKSGVMELNSTNSQYRRDLRANYDRYWYLPTGVLVIEIGELS